MSTSRIVRATAPQAGGAVSRSDWDQILAGDPGAVASQGPAWMDAMVATGGYEDVSRLYERGGRRAVLPLLRRRSALGARSVEVSVADGSGIGGLVGARDPELVRAAFRDLADRPAVSVRIRPDPLDADLWAAACPPRVCAVPRRAHVLELDGGPAGVWAGFASSTRNRVRRAEKSGLDVSCHTGGEELDQFFALYDLSLDRWAEQSREPRALARARARRRDPAATLVRQAEALGDDFRLWLARRGAEPVAAVVVVLGPAALNTRGAMDRELAGPTHANALLQWSAIQDALEAGCTRYHLGETGPSSSLAHFKEKLGARSVPYREYRVERLPLTRIDGAARTVVKRAIGFRDD